MSDSQSRTTEVIVVNAIFLSVSCLAVGLRLTSRWLSAARFWWDDACITLSLIFVFGSSTFNFVAAANGAGKHVVSPTEIVALKKIIYGSEILYGPHITSIKTAILLLYLRLFGVRKSFKIAILAVEAFVVAWGIATLFASIFQANPISAIWNPDQPYTHVNYTKYLIGTAVPNVVTDFVILILPISIVWQLQISKRRKIALCGIFLLGTFVCGVSIVRAYIVATINNDDASYEYAGSLVWSSIEVNVGIICACLPVLQPVIQKWFGAVLGGSKNSKFGVPTSRQKIAMDNSGATSTNSTASFSKLEDGVFNGPVNSLVTQIGVSAGGHNNKNRISGVENQPVPLNAIHVKKNVDLINKPRNQFQA